MLDYPKKVSEVRKFYESLLANNEKERREAQKRRERAVEEGNEREEENANYKLWLLRETDLRHQGSLDALNWIDSLAPELLKEAPHD